jgi:ferredoxin
VTDRGHPVRLQPAGWAFPARDDETLLQAALRAGIRMPSSCRNGSCRACRCLLVVGRIQYTVEWPGLTREEKDEGWVLPCVARALTAVTLEVPDAQSMQENGQQAPRSP